MNKPKFQNNFDIAISRLINRSIDEIEFDNLEFELIPVDDKKGKTTSKDSWMNLAVIPSKGFIKNNLSYSETVKTLSAGKRNYPLWIKLKAINSDKFSLKFSTRFRNLKSCHNQEGGIPPFEIGKH